MKTKQITVAVYSLDDGKKLQNEVLNFEEEVGVKNPHVFYLTKKYQQAATRAGTASTKTVSEVSGGGAKPYKQKGTGRARRGTNRTVLRPGGGIVFGPKPRSYKHKLNKKVIKSAIVGALHENQENIFVVRYDKATLKTKAVSAFLANTPTLIIIKSIESPLYRASRNIDNVRLCSVSSIPIEKLLSSPKVMLDQDAFETLKEVTL